MLKLLIISALFSQIIFSKELNTSGKFEFVNDKYFNSLNYSDQKLKTTLLADQVFEFGNFNFELDITSFRRDKQSSYYNLKSFNLSKNFLNLDFLVGFKIFNWGNLEVFTPNDLINSEAQDFDFLSKNKIGELTFSVSKQLRYGKFNFMLFPFVNKNIHPSNISPYSNKNKTLNNYTLLTNKASKSIKEYNLQFALSFDFEFFGFVTKTFFISHYDRQHPLIGTSQYSGNITNSVPVDSIKFRNYPEVYLYKENVFGVNLLKHFKNITYKAEVNMHIPVTDKKVLTDIGLKTAGTYFEQAYGAEYLLKRNHGREYRFYFEMIFANESKNRFIYKETLFQSDYTMGVKYFYNDRFNQKLAAFYIGDFKQSHERILKINYVRNLNNLWKLSSEFQLVRATSKSSSVKGQSELEFHDGLDKFTLAISRTF